MGAAFTDLLRRYVSKLVIFDIGARGGLHERWAKFWPIIETIGFEPEKVECNRLNQSAKDLPYKARFLPYALGRKTDETVPFYTCRKPGCSSTYRPNDAFIQDFPFAPQMTVEAVGTMQTVTLSDVCLKEQTQPDVLKIDVQGAELDVLLGGVSVLKHTMLVEAEVEFNPQYQEQPLFHDVDRFMVQQGFRLLGLRRDYWRRAKGLDANSSGCGGTLMHGDALYYNARLMENLTLATIMKWLVILSAYRQNDFVLSLLQHPALSILTIEEREALRGALVHRLGWKSKAVRVLWSGVPQRMRRQLVDSLQAGHVSDWHDADFF